MKKISFITLLMAFAAICSVSAQDVDQILKHHFDAIGQKNLLKIKTLQASGKALIMGMENPFTMMSKRPDKIKVVVDYQGSQIIQAYDGKTVWTVNPMMGSAVPVVLTGPQADAIAESADLDGQLWKYREKGHRLELEGTENVNGKEAYVLKLTKKTGNIDYYYLDKDSYLILKVGSTAMMNGSEVAVETLLSNYKDVGGYLMPHTTEQWYGGQAVNKIQIEEVKLNEKMDDSIFSMPEGPA